MNDLATLTADIADAIVALDRSGVPFKAFQPGAGPYGEPQLVGHVVKHLNSLHRYAGLAQSKRTPDLLIRGRWALEIKIARPFGDNGKQAENWSVNLLHPYPGNVSAIGDALKLSALELAERRAVIVVGYEHTPPEIPLAPLFSAFEAVAAQQPTFRLGPRNTALRTNLIHPVHRQVVVVSWEVLRPARRPARR